MLHQFNDINPNKEVDRKIHNEFSRRNITTKL